MERKTPSNFVSTVYGNLTPLNNSALSKARLKIFYKGLNRNGSLLMMIKLRDYFLLYQELQ